MVFDESRTVGTHKVDLSQLISYEDVVSEPNVRCIADQNAGLVVTDVAPHDGDRTLTSLEEQSMRHVPSESEPVENHAGVVEVEPEAAGEVTDCAVVLE